MQDQVNRLYRLQSELDTRDYKRTGRSVTPGVDRYIRLANARGNMLRERGYIDVQNYGNNDSVLMTRKQVAKMDSIENPIARANYVNRLYEGNSNG